MKFTTKQEPTCSIVSEYNVCTVQVNSFVVVLHRCLKVFLLICCITQILLCYSLHTEIHLHEKYLGGKSSSIHLYFLSTWMDTIQLVAPFSIRELSSVRTSRAPGPDARPGCSGPFIVGPEHVWAYNQHDLWFGTCFDIWRATNATYWPHYYVIHNEIMNYIIMRSCWL